MSLYETPMIEAFFARIGGGILLLEYRAVESGDNHGCRSMDAVIVLGESESTEQFFMRCLVKVKPTLKGKDIIVVQAKTGRLGMNLLGQALFSRHLMERHQPASIRTVALCQADDAILRPLAEQYGIEVVIDPTEYIRSEQRSNSLRYGGTR